MITYDLRCEGAEETKRTVMTEHRRKTGGYEKDLHFSPSPYPVHSIVKAGAVAADVYRWHSNHRCRYSCLRVNLPC